MRIETSSPRSLLSSLGDILDQHRVSAEEASAVRGAVQGLSPDAPLTLEMIESLKLSPGVTGALVFTWIRHKYPDLIKDQLRTASTAADVIRNLIWEEKQKPAEFAVELHRGLTTQPKVEREVDLVAFEAAIARAHEDGASLHHVAESPEKILLELKPPELDPALAAFFPGKTTLRLLKEDGRWEAQWDLGGKTYFNYLDTLAPDAIRQLEHTLKTAQKSLALGELGAALLKDLPAMRERYTPPAHPALRTIETFLRFALGAHRVGETEIDILNELIEGMLEGSRLALAGESIETSVLTLGNSDAPKEVVQDPLQVLFGVSKRVPPPPPVADDPPKSTGRKKAPPKDPQLQPTPDPKTDPQEDFLISDLKRSFSPDGPNADLIPYVKTVEETLIRMAGALSKLRERLGTKSISVTLNQPHQVTKGRL
jgi:hypothetical protein